MSTSVRVTADAPRLGERRRALRGALRSEGLDALLVTHLPNVRYLTGFSGTAGIVLVLEDDVVLLTDFRYRTQAESEAGGCARVEIVSSDLFARVGELLSEYGTLRVGFEEHSVSVKDWGRLRALEAQGRPAAKLAPAGPLVERLRERKDPTEVGLIRRAAELACDAFRSVLEVIGPGRREVEVASALEGALRERGSEWFPFPTIVASGVRSSLPHAGTTPKVIERGDLVVLDFGARVEGYCADVTRTLVVGRADRRQREVYEVVRLAQLEARRGMRAGMRGSDADSLAREVIEVRGFGEAFGHSLGHGLGIEVHEEPRLSKSNDAPLPEGAVVTVEPGVYLPGWGGVRIEDDVYMGPAGCELLSDGASQLLEVR